MQHGRTTLVSNTAYGTAGRRVDHGVAALPNNGEESSHAQMEKEGD